MANDKQVSLINIGHLSFRTSGGPLGPGAQVSIPAEEAARLLKYPGVKDASKYQPPVDEVAALRKENADLKAKLAEALKGKGKDK